MKERKSMNTGSAILGSAEKFDLRSVPFGIRGSYLCILEDREDRSLYLSISRSPALLLDRKNLVKIAPVVDNKEIPFEYAVEPGKLTIKTYRGTAEFCFAGQKQLRVRGNGLSLRFSFKMRMFENCSPKENGDFEIAYEILGKLLFVPLKGAVWCNAKWNHNTVQADDFIIDLIPPVETMRFEAAVHEFFSNGNRDEDYELFDDCVAAAERDFEAFRKRFGNVPEKYAKMAKLAAWTVWTHTLRPQGRLKGPVVYESRVARLAAFGHGQCYQAMAACADVREAWKQLLTMFDYQNGSGQIPHHVSEVGVVSVTASPALQGVALDFILNRCDLRGLKTEDYAELYAKLSRYADWWLIKRDRNKSGIPQVYHVDESGWVDATIFKKGLPLQSGELLAFLAMLTESCAKLAEKAGIADGGKWMKASNRLLDVLISEFWNGRQFVGKAAGTGETVESESIVTLLPVILGERLPEDIVHAIAHRLADEGEYLTPGGVVSERLGSPDFSISGGFMRGNIVAAVQLLLSVGLKNAGKAELARGIAKRYCDLACEKGLSPALAPFGYDLSGDWTSEAAAVFLAIAAYVLGR